jgi:alanyl-tRNA synthetase
MEKTERLYYSDSYLREFEARIRAVEPASGGFHVWLDRTALYPESGGQPSDRGTLDGIRILDVVDEGETIAHLVETKPEADGVKGTVDWKRRFDHMQQHTGQHVLSAAFERVGGYKTVSFHLGAEASSIDLDSNRLGEQQCEEAEDLANSVVFEDRAVKVQFRSVDEANRMGLRKMTSREGDVRLVEVENFDLSACGGTHVSRTGAIGLIALRKVERMKGLTRIEFLCGGRALQATRREFKTLEKSARLFSGSAVDLPSFITKHLEELKSTLRSRELMAGQLAGYIAQSLAGATTKGEGSKVIQHVVSAGSPVKGKHLAHALAAIPEVVALIGEEGDPARLYFAQSPGGPHDMGLLMKKVLAETGGKGGGARDFSQGGGLGADKLDHALALAERLLE